MATTRQRSRYLVEYQKKYYSSRNLSESADCLALNLLSMLLLASERTKNPCNVSTDTKTELDVACGRIPRHRRWCWPSICLCVIVDSPCRTLRQDSAAGTFRQRRKTFLYSPETSGWIQASFAPWRSFIPVGCASQRNHIASRQTFN